jgi:hypothetical protein
MIYFIQQLCLLIIAVVIFVRSEDHEKIVPSVLEHRYAAGIGRHLDASSWPTDHGDSARSKFSLNAGLPKSFEASSLAVKVQEQVEGPQWFYTQGDNSKYLFVLGGGKVTNTSIFKLDALSLDVLETFQLPSSLYLGGMLMHRNGHVYTIHANKLYAFWNGELSNHTVVTLPTFSLNEGLVQTNGMLVTQDGLIVVKQWSTNMHDLLFYAAAIPQMIQVFVAVLIISLTYYIASAYRYIHHKKQQLRMHWLLIYAAYIIAGAAVGILISLVAVVLLMMKITDQGFDPVKFVYDSRPFDATGGGGELKFIDPLSLEVVTAAILPERCSIARMAMIGVKNPVSGEPEDAMILLGDELAYQFRWRPKSKTIVQHRDWTRRYRRHRDGSYPATGASLFNGTAYFTDNTFPVFLSGQTYRMYRAPLLIEQLDHTSQAVGISIHHHGRSREDRAQQYQNRRRQMASYYHHAKIHAPVEAGVHLTERDPGFMFWSVVVSPFEGQIITWDTVGRSIQARSLSDLSLQWSAKSWQADCLTVAADRGHVYTSDCNRAPATANEWLPVIGRSSVNGNYHALDKYFVVLNASNGAVLANITIAEKQPIRLSMIIPGGNNDVFLGTANGLVRIYYNGSDTALE